MRWRHGPWHLTSLVIPTSALHTVRNEIVNVRSLVRYEVGYSHIHTYIHTYICTIRCVGAHTKSAVLRLAMMRQAVGSIMMRSPHSHVNVMQSGDSVGRVTSRQDITTGHLFDLTLPPQILTAPANLRGRIA
ncbi:hypothetical protein K503DRAFT_233932 [Rhizopogon vinicolor AM-OR11-026]|uniref:Secreted protein n=1 Tax=Rhizopogon vinicolor AM-OR11-026 TaxID=1314800 RepID=A0A1B7NDY6_9AGAM|nr:hypothetical protein K503DRAFT_233932 [Rhizopogon vinicolor AM-OR11-026]